MVMSTLGAVSLKLLTTGLPIAREARLLYTTLRERRSRKESAPELDSGSLSAAVEQIGTRLETLDADQERQAELISKMVTQEEALSRGLQAVSARVTVLIWVSGAALLMASIAVALALLL